MIRWFIREWRAARTSIADEQARQTRQREMQLISFAVQWGRVHYHLEKMKYPTLYVTPDECIRRGQKEAIELWGKVKAVQEIECTAFIGAFMDGWKQGMEEW